MIIQCTSCGLRAELPDGKEGAKVRCSDCGHVYVARPAPVRSGARGAARRQRREDPTKYFLVGGVVVVVAIVAIVASRGGGEDVPVAAADEPVEEEPFVPATGWDSPLVKVARSLHDDVHARRSSELYTSIDFREAHAWWTGRDAAADPGDGEAAEAPAQPARHWDSLAADEQTSFQNHLVDDLLEGSGKELVADWSPFDGHVVSEVDGAAIVRVRVQHRDEAMALQDRWVEWRFVRRGDAWKAAAWERWISPEEVQTERRERAKKTVKKTLSDGSLVIEGEVRTTIEYHEETPQELRDEIEERIDTLIDLEAHPSQVTASRGRLEEIGKHAVPGLLKRMGEIPLSSEENAIQLNLVHLLLQDITGYITTFDVHEAMGTTEERQASGVRQWFGWYDRRWKKFWREADVAADEEELDPFLDDPDFLPRNEKERREFEKIRRELEEQKAKEKDG